MSDVELRNLERRFRQTDAPDDEGRLLTARVRAGQLPNRVLLRAALFGSPAARLAVGVSSEGDTEDLTQEEMNEVLQLVFRDTEIPARTREFLDHLVRHDHEARATLSHYEIVQEGDKAPPDTATALKALMDNLRSNQNHREAINQMQRPVLQLIPVYEPEGVGFQRMVGAIDAHRRGDQINTFVWLELQNRWGMNAEVPGKIVGWQVAVTEGAKVLPRESNRFLERNGRIQRLEDQLNQWQEYCKQQGLQLCEKGGYALLQMQETRQAAPGTPLNEMGLDPENVTYLGDRTRQPGSFVPSGY